MYRPVIDWMEDQIDHRERGYLKLIDESNSLLETILSWQAELIRKQAVWLSEKEKNR